MVCLTREVVDPGLKLPKWRILNKAFLPGELWPRLEDVSYSQHEIPQKNVLGHITQDPQRGKESEWCRYENTLPRQSQERDTYCDIVKHMLFGVEHLGILIFMISCLPALPITNYVIVALATGNNSYPILSVVFINVGIRYVIIWTY